MQATDKATQWITDHPAEWAWLVDNADSFDFAQ